MYILKPLSKEPDALIRVKKSLTSKLIDEVLDGLVSKYIDLSMPDMNLSSTLSLKQELVSTGLSLFDRIKANLGLLSERFHHPSATPAFDDAPSFAYMSLLNHVKLDEDAPQLGLDVKRRNFLLTNNETNPGIVSSDFLHMVNMKFTANGTAASSATVTVNERLDNESGLGDVPGRPKRHIHGIPLPWKNYGVMELQINQPFIFFIKHFPTNLTLFWGTVNDPTMNWYFVSCNSPLDNFLGFFLTMKSASPSIGHVERQKCYGNFTWKLNKANFGNSYIFSYMILPEPN